MWTALAPLSQPCTTNLPFSCRCAPVLQQQSHLSTKHSRRATQDSAPNFLTIDRRLCSVGVVAGVCGFIVAGRNTPFSSTPQAGSQVGLSQLVNSQTGLQPVNAERVYELEGKLQRKGFTEKQARALILAAACLRRLGKDVTFDDVGKVFNTAWQVEDDMLEAGFTRMQARQLGLMFVALASTKQDRNIRSSSYPYLDFWDGYDARGAGDCLERVGVAKYEGYALAEAILNFARQEWDS